VVAVNKISMIEMDVKSETLQKKKEEAAESTRKLEWGSAFSLDDK